ncbi:hypothetical protein N7540_006098 [Penicillium herquei]|nr:hypothetical protein N7540_006098 [Penicillium herquei]
MSTSSLNMANPSLVMAVFGYLPTELVMEIAGYLRCLEMYQGPEIEYRSALQQKQVTLAKFCLVNSQWYSVAISMLYFKPIFASGGSFQKFLRTICSTPKNRRQAYSDLGLLIRHLDLSNLIHESSNSKTARLLNKARGLRLFSAPQSSFSLNCLAPLSKCSEMTFLDLSRAHNTGITFPVLKNTMSKLKKLWRLSLPASIKLTPCIPESEGGPGQWPESLIDLVISGELDHEVMKVFEWPRNLLYLEISHAKGLSDLTIDAILSNPGIQPCLESFIIKSNCSYLEFGHFDEAETSVMYGLPSLDRVEIPCDMARFFGMLDTNEPVMGFKCLVLTEPVDGEGEYVDPDLGGDIVASLEYGPLCEIWALELPRSFMREYNLHRHHVDALVMSHLDDVSDDELDDWHAPPGLSIRK